MQTVGKLRDGVAELPVESRFKVLRDIELESIPAIEWLVNDLLPGGGFSAVIGPPASGKTFVAIDLALSVAAGVPWCGRAVTQGNVLYVAAEGHRGLRTRELAWKDANGIATVPQIGFITEPVQLLDQSDIDHLLLAIDRFAAEPKLVVIDTFARCLLGGDENSAAEVGRAVEAMRQLQEKTGTSVLLVHHSKKGVNAVERGSSALRGALDALVNVTKDGPHVTISCGKMKDAAEFEVANLLLVNFNDSCVLKSVEAGPADFSLGDKDQAVLSLLAHKGLRHGEWKKRAVENGISVRSFNRALKRLTKVGLVTPTGRIYRPASETTLENGASSNQSLKTGTVAPSRRNAAA